jgi:hypothetical protein
MTVEQLRQIVLADIDHGVLPDQSVIDALIEAAQAEAFEALREAFEARLGDVEEVPQ